MPCNCTCTTSCKL